MQNIADKKTRRLMHTNERLLKVAAEKALDSEILLTQEAGYLQPEGLERTWKFQQREIKKHVDITTSKKMFELKLPELGPYYMDYTRNGRHMLIGGGKGHIASFDWKQGKIECELQVRETVRDVKWLHNETMFAVAQKKYTYLYDKTGLELHCLKEHIEATVLDYLPYHFLLVSAVFNF